MKTAEAYLFDLWRVAPHADPALLRTLASLLSRLTAPDLALIVADAMIDAADQLLYARYSAAAGELRALAGLLRDEGALANGGSDGPDAG